MVNDVTVGSVSGIDAVQRPDGTFYASVKVSLDRDVNLPANAMAKVAQTSLLGSQHIELSAPTTEAGTGRLAEGATIPLSPDGPLPDHRRGAVLAGHGGEQGQSGGVAGHHRRGVCRGGRPRRQLHRPDPQAGAADRLAGARPTTSSPPPTGSTGSQGSWRPTRTAWAAHWTRCRVRCGSSTPTGPTSSTPSRPWCWWASSRLTCWLSTIRRCDFKGPFPAVKALNDYSYYFIKDLSFLPTFRSTTKYLQAGGAG